MIKILSTLLMTLLFGSQVAFAAENLKVRVHGSIKSTTCTFKNDNILFNFGKVDAGVFSGVGSATPWITESFISAGCDPAINKVYMTFDGEADDNDPELIKVTGGASGVAIELRSYDNYIAIPGNPTPMFWEPRLSGGKYEFKARYVQTKERLIGGMANARLVVNLTYE